VAGGSLSKQDWTIQWPTAEPGKENSPGCQPEPGQWGRTLLSQSPKVQPKCGQHHCHGGSPHGPMYTHVDRLTVEGHPGLCPPVESGHRSLPPSPRQRHMAHTPPRTPNIVTTMTPPGTPPVRRRNKLKPPGTPPPSSRKLIHLIPGFTALHRSKSHEFQLGHRVDEAHTPKVKKKNKPLNLKIHNSVGSCENIPAQRSPLLSERSLRSFFVGYPPFLPSTPPVHTEATFSANTLSVPRWSPQIPRRDLGNSIKHRFSTKYWMSQTCTVCGKGMLFGLKCKNCKLKCHNKCTKEAPPCHLLIIHRGARLVRTESVPCDINNPLRKPPRYSDLHVSQTLPKTNKLNKDHIPVPYQPDSSSNPSSTTSSTPSSPAPPLPPSATPPSPLHPSPQCPRQQKQFNLSASHYYKYKQQFIFPDVVPETPTRAPQVILHPVNSNPILEGNPLLQIEVEPTSEVRWPGSLLCLTGFCFIRVLGHIPQEPAEFSIRAVKLPIIELMARPHPAQAPVTRRDARRGLSARGIFWEAQDGVSEQPLALRSFPHTIYSPLRLPMGLCPAGASPGDTSRALSLCKGRTLYSVVRDAKIVLDVNKTRQIAQEIVKGMGYLHAKGILHKDLKSKNVFYDNGKVVITDFGLFSISGVLQAGR
ncbi:KSR2 Kinase, partial [Glareola pratincola]|nr:KSR2 Kinase [Glareola pratincola]